MENKKEKKKIMFLITGSNMGGAEVVVKNLIFNLDKEEFDTSLVSVRPLGIIGEEISKKTKVYSLGASLKFNPIFIFRLFRILRNEKPDILHCHLFHANLIGRIVGRLAGVPRIISTVHSDNIGSNLRYFLLRITDFMNDITIVVSNKIKEGLLEKKVVSENKIKVIYNGVEDPDLTITEEDIQNKKRELGIENNSPILLSVGRLHPVKGHIYLIRAMRLIVDEFPKSKLIMIGDGPERENLANEVDKLKLRDNVLFLGEIKAEDIYYRLADVFVLPSLVEGFGLTIIEAMKNNCLVVASDVGGVSEVMDIFKMNNLVRPMSVESLRDEIIEVYKSDNLVKLDLFLNSRFTAKKMLASYLEIYS